MSPSYRPDIDGLRAVAVLSVLLYHVDPRLIPGGFLGVDIFFVLSGYLISLIVLREQARGEFRFRTFYARRIRRLFPALAIVLLSVLGFGYFALFADEYERLARHAFYSIAFLLNFRLMDEAGYFDVVSKAKPLLHLWSLSVEEQFYLVWPAVLIAVRRLRMNAGIVIVVLGASSLVFARLLANFRPDELYFHPMARAWELLVGCCLAWWHLYRGAAGMQSRRMRDGLSLAGMAAILYGLFALGGSLRHPHPLVLIPLAGVTAVIAAGTSARVNRLLAAPPIVFIGLISYPLYLWHWPLLSYLHITESGNPPSWMQWVAVALSFALAWMTFVFLERPIRSGTNARRSVVTLSASMLALMVASRLIVETDGLAERPAVRYALSAEAMMKREPRQDAECTALFESGQAPVYCRRSPGGPETIAIIGDSHAHVLFPGIAELATPRGISTLLLANSGCPPFDGAVTGRTEGEKEECANNIEKILRTVERDSNIVSVVIASRGPQYIDGKGFGPVEAGYDYPPISGTGGPGSPGVAFVEGLRATVHRVHAGKRAVVYVLQVPELGVPARDCLLRPLVLVSQRGCKVAYEVYRDRMREYRLLVEALHAEAHFMQVVDPAPAFCNAIECNGLGKEGLLYSDDNHLSLLGSRRVAPLVFAALEKRVVGATPSPRP